MEYIIIGLIGLVIILEIINIIKNFNESNIIERLGKMETSINKEIGEFKLSFSSDLKKDFDSLNNKIEERLNKINEKVNERLDVNFEKTNRTFNNVLERLAKIDEAQKKIDNLSSDIVSLQSILTDKKSRGIFGEVTLKYILESIFGVNDRVYKLQCTLPNNTIADSVIYGPEPLGTIAVDSKFPLENYRAMVEKGLTVIERETRSKMFENDVKKHIDSISEKYIIEGVTTNQAIMFLPAEAIFAEINAYHPNLIKYAASKRVWITSPTTLMSLLTIIATVLKGLERDKYASIIHDELNKLGIEFDKYRNRWDKLSKSIDTVQKEVKDINITTEKITKRFGLISNVDLDRKEIEWRGVIDQHLYLVYQNWSITCFFLRKILYNLIGDLECDFIARRGIDEYFYIQVSKNIDDKMTEEREYKPFYKIKQMYPKYLFVSDLVLQKNVDGIKNINIVDFIYNEEELK